MSTRLREFAGARKKDENRWKWQDAFYDSVQRREQAVMDRERTRAYFTAEGRKPEYREMKDTFTLPDAGEREERRLARWTALVVGPALETGVLHHAEVEGLAEREEREVIAIDVCQLHTEEERSTASWMRSQEYARVTEQSPFLVDRTRGDGRQRVVPYLGVVLTAEPGYAPKTTNATLRLHMYHPAYEGETTTVTGPCRVVWTQVGAVQAMMSQAAAAESERAGLTQPASWGVYEGRRGGISLNFRKESGEWQSPRNSFWRGK